ncbi:hypothetical protein ACFS07_05415 [Undibacterium arcticum]
MYSTPDEIILGAAVSGAMTGAGDGFAVASVRLGAGSAIDGGSDGAARLVSGSAS